MGRSTRMRPMRAHSATCTRCVLFALTLMLGTGWAVDAAADGPAVEIDRIRGPGGRAVERALAEALSERGVEVTDSAEVRITGRVRRTGRRQRRRYHLALTVHHRGDEVERVRVVERRPGQLTPAAMDALLPILQTAREREQELEAPAVEAPARAVRQVRPEPVAPDPPPTFQSGDGENALEFAVGIEWLARHLSFNDDLFGRIGTYRLDAAPAVSVAARWFPARHWTAHALAGIGVEAEARGAFGISSTTPDGGGTYETSIDDWRLGGMFHGRLFDLLQLEGALSYGEARFRIDPLGPAHPGSPVEPLPSVRYRYLRTAVGADVDLVEGLSVGGGVGFRAVLSSGQLAYREWFPRSSTAGVDLRLRVTWRFDRWFAVRAYIQHIRYISALNPEPGDARVAGGAQDEWTTAGVELVSVLPGMP